MGKKLLAAFLLVTIVLGLSYGVYRISYGVVRAWQVDNPAPVP